MSRSPLEESESSGWYWLLLGKEKIFLPPGKMSFFLTKFVKHAATGSGNACMKTAPSGLPDSTLNEIFLFIFTLSTKLVRGDDRQQTSTDYVNTLVIVVPILMALPGPQALLPQTRMEQNKLGHSQKALCLRFTLPRHASQPPSQRHRYFPRVFLLILVTFDLLLVFKNFSPLVSTPSLSPPTRIPIRKKKIISFRKTKQNNKPRSKVHSASFFFREEL